MFDRKEYMKRYNKQYSLKNPGYIKKYHKKHEERLNEYSKQWRKDNPEYMKQWYIKNPEHIKGDKKQYRINNPDYEKQYYQNNKEKALEHNRRYLKTEKGKAHIQRTRFKRRNLGFKPLNKFVKGSEAHHIDKVYIIFMPKKIHRSISHCLESGKNMEEINKLAMDFI